MINFHYEAAFSIREETKYADWLTRVVFSEGFGVGELSYIFCDDNYLLDINQKYLAHDTFTDIISFDYTLGTVVSGDVFISIDRVVENADVFGVSFENELLRVMSHGLLHLLGYGDKTKGDIDIMRGKEEEKIKLFHVEQ